jgi:acid phosphatase family membrane protein YuiD
MISSCDFFHHLFQKRNILHSDFTICTASHFTDLANSFDILQVMYDAFGVRLHAGKQAEVLPPFYVI